MSGSSISYCIRVSGSGLLRGIASEGTPNTGSATAQIKLDDNNKNSVQTALDNSASFMNVRDGFYGVSVTRALTGSNISANVYNNSAFRVWIDTGLAGVGGSQLLKVDNNGNLTVSGSISGSNLIANVDGGAF